MFDSTTIENSTFRNKKHVEKLRNKIDSYDKDPYKAVRQGEMLCKHCFYIINDRVAGQAFCTKKCSNCGREMSFGTTDADELCMQCAKELNCCKYCGAKMD